MIIITAMVNLTRFLILTSVFFGLIYKCCEYQMMAWRRRRQPTAVLQSQTNMIYSQVTTTQNNIGKHFHHFRICADFSVLFHTQEVKSAEIWIHPGPSLRPAVHQLVKRETSSEEGNEA